MRNVRYDELGLAVMPVRFQRLLSREEAAHILNVHVRTVDFYIRKPRIAKRPRLNHVKIGKTVRIIPGDLEKFINACEANRDQWLDEK